MKINIVIPSFFPATVYGGPIFSSLNTARALVNLGHKIIVTTTNANRPSRLDVAPNKPIQLEKGIEVFYFNDTILDRFSLPLLRNAGKNMKEVDVVHVQYTFSLPTPIALYYAKKYRKPLLFSPRGALASWILENGLQFKKQWIKYLLMPYEKSIWFHATSKQEENEIKSVFPEARVFVIPNGIDQSEYNQEVKITKADLVYKYVGIKREESFPLVVSLGRLHKKKGFDILIDAFKMVVETLPEAILMIAGENDGERENLLGQIERLGLGRHVFLLGEVKGADKVALLSLADVFALSSHNENFGNVYAEALAAGTPIVASKMTPWEDIEINKCGKWVENTDKDFAKAIKEILEGDRTAYYESARKYISNFTWQSIALKFQLAFEEMQRKAS